LLKDIAELLETEFSVLVEHPWLASIAVFIAGVLLVAAWLMTAWRLGKWYYGRELSALRSENEWLRRREQVLQRRVQSLEKMRYR